MKRKWYKKIIALSCAAMLSLAVCLPASANSSDTALSGFAGYYYSEALKSTNRSKENTTRVYVNMQTMPGSGAGIRTFGLCPDGSGNYTWQNKTYVGTAYLYSTGKYSVRNWIYEDGGRVAYLEVTSVDYNGGYFSGIWSPDSVGSYEVK